MCCIHGKLIWTILLLVRLGSRIDDVTQLSTIFRPFVVMCVVRLLRWIGSFFSFSCIFALSLSLSLSVPSIELYLYLTGACRDLRIHIQIDVCTDPSPAYITRSFLCFICVCYVDCTTTIKKRWKMPLRYIENTQPDPFLFFARNENSIFCCLHSFAVFFLKNMCATPFLVFIFYFLQVFFVVLFRRIISPGHIPSWCVTSHRPHLWNITWGLGGWWWEGCRLEYPHGWDWMAWFGCRNFAPALFEMSAKYIWASIFNLGLFLDQSLSSFDDKRLCALLY